MNPERNRHLELPAELRREHARELIARELETVQHFWSLSDADVEQVLEELHYCYAGGTYGIDDEAAAALAADQEGGVA